MLSKIACDPVTQACIDKTCTSYPSLKMEVIDCEIIANYRWRKRDEKFCEKSGEEVYMVKQQNDIIR